MNDNNLFDDVYQQLERDAAEFFREPGRAPSDGLRSWTIFDLEFAWDRAAHEAYTIAEGASAQPGNPRWPFDRVAAVAWLTLTEQPGSALPIVTPPVVMTAEQHDEQAMVSALFNALVEHRSIVTSWGGEARDHAVLRRAAMRHGLLLPPQLRNLVPFAPRKLDLCRALCVQATYVHLPELAAALSIPCKPSPSTSIGRLVENGEWGRVREQVLADVLTTTVVALETLSMTGEVSWQPTAATAAVAEVTAAALPHSRFVAGTFHPWAASRRLSSGGEATQGLRREAA